MWCAVKIIHKRWFNLTIMMIVDLIKTEKRIQMILLHNNHYCRSYSNRVTNSNLVHIEAVVYMFGMH